MCYSVEVQKDLKLIAQRFDVELLLKDEVWYEKQKAMATDLNFVKQALGLSRKPSTPFFKEPGPDERIYPGYFTDVIVMENAKRVFKKMRYRVRPAGAAGEIPSKYNVFNARIDALEKRKTWVKLFGRQHGLLPFKSFYEWVEKDGKTAQIKFHPQGRDLMWAPCLYDYWKDPKSDFGFYSFAIITDDPPAEVSMMGHDRCPIFLNEECIEGWLNPSGKSYQRLYELLKLKEVVKYDYAWAA